MNNYFKLIGVLTLGMALYSCGGDRNNQSGETTTPVWVDDVRQRTIEEFITTTGTEIGNKRGLCFTDKPEDR